MGWDVTEQTTTYFPGARLVNTPHNKRVQEIIAKGTAEMLTLLMLHVTLSLSQTWPRLNLTVSAVSATLMVS